MANIAATSASTLLQHVDLRKSLPHMGDYKPIQRCFTNERRLCPLSGALSEIVQAIFQ